MDFIENRLCGYCDRVLSGNILCADGNEAASCFQGHFGWYSYNASGASPDGGRFHSASDIQSETSLRGVSAGTL